MNQHFSQATNELRTVRDWLRFAVSRFYQAELFFGHGISDAYDEAAYLILHTLHLPLDRLSHFSMRASPIANGLRYSPSFNAVCKNASPPHT